MIPFAVHHEGLPAAAGKWVLAVQGERLLLSDDDGKLYWKRLDTCKLVRAHTPDMPTAVLPVMPQQKGGAGIVVPGPGTLGRNGHN